MPHSYGQSALGGGIRRIGDRLSRFFTEQDQEKKDKEYLEWLSGQIPTPPAALPPPPTAPAHAAVAGPELPPGMVEPDPSVAPQGPQLPGGDNAGPFSAQYLDHPEQLLEADQKAAADLFKSPAKTLNLLLEAKKRGTSEAGTGSILDFIRDLHREQAAAQESEKKITATAKLDEKRTQQRVELEDKKANERAIREAEDQAFRERMAERAHKVRFQIAGMRDKKGPLDERDVKHLSQEQLDALDAELAEEEKNLKRPDREGLDSYEPFDMIDYREGSKRHYQTKAEIGGLRSTIRRVQAARGKGAPAGAGPRKPAGPVRIKDDADFNALAPGTEFIGPDGVTRRKP